MSDMPTSEIIKLLWVWFWGSGYRANTDVSTRYIHRAVPNHPTELKFSGYLRKTITKVRFWAFAEILKIGEMAAKLSRAPYEGLHIFVICSAASDVRVT